MSNDNAGTFDIDWTEVHARMEALRVESEASHELAPAERQQILRRRAAELALAPSNDDDVEMSELLAFRCGEQIYCLAVEQMDVVVQVPVLSIPGLGGLHRGVVNHRGTIIAVIDVGLLLGRAPMDVSEQLSVIVINADGQRLGLTADEVLGISRLPAADIQPLQAVEGSYSHGAIIGITPGSWLVLDAVYLAQDARLIVDEEVQIQGPSGENGP